MRRCRGSASDHSYVTVSDYGMICERGVLIAYQKLFGLYLLATMRRAIFESSSIGYTPYEALGKCSLTCVPKLLSRLLLYHQSQYLVLNNL